jgi:hypothetical protein
MRIPVRERPKTHLTFIDFHKAFDTIDRGKLIYRLSNSELPPSVERAIRLTLKDTKIKTKTGTFKTFKECHRE